MREKRILMSNPLLFCHSFEESYTIETEPQNDDADEEFSDIRHPSLRKRMGLNIPQAVDIMKSKLESSNDLSEFTDKCKELIEKKFGSISRLDKTGSFAPTTNASESDLSESDVDQVLIAVTPKKRLKDFLADSERGYQCEVSLEKEEAIFDICVYVPRSQSWFCFGEGTNCGIFKEIGQKKSHWPINFCTNDKLCCVSLDRKILYMYPLKRDSDGDRTDWSSVSYANLIRESIDTEFDARRDVRVCCYDGESLVIKMKSSNEWGEDLEVVFSCYRLSRERTWEYMFEIQADDDLDIYESNTFDVNNSLDKKVMLIAVQSYRLHVFRISLEGRVLSYDEHILGNEDLENENSEINYIPRPHFLIIRNGTRLSFVDEFVTDESNTITYRNLMVKGEANGMSIDNVEKRTIKPHLSSDLQLDATSKLFQSVGTGRCAWLYLSDGLFQTSLDEIRLSKHSGLLEFKQHISPPFQSVTILAAGVVKRDILENLKPLNEFLQQ